MDITLEPSTKTMLLVFLAFILNDMLIGFAFYELWRKNFGFHIVYCGGCGHPTNVSNEVMFIDECRECHVCESCGKTLYCKTCGKKHLVRHEIESVEFCGAIGCIQKYKTRHPEEFEEEG